MPEIVLDLAPGTQIIEVEGCQTPQGKEVPVIATGKQDDQQPEETLFSSIIFIRQ